MKIIYDKLKNKRVIFPDCEGLVCGYTENRLIIATETNSRPTFRRLDKGGGFIENEYKDHKFRYCYADERDVYKSNPKLRWS